MPGLILQYWLSPMGSNPVRLAQPLHGEFDIVGLEMPPACNFRLVSVFREPLKVFRGELLRVGCVRRPQRFNVRLRQHLWLHRKVPCRHLASSARQRLKTNPCRANTNLSDEAASVGGLWLSVPPRNRWRCAKTFPHK